MRKNVAAASTASLATADDDSPWTKKMILCFDGGGVRGLSSLFILQSLMKEITRLEKSSKPPASCSANSIWDQEPGSDDATRPNTEFLPCHYFDYIGGTSTGGLIAVMLGRLRMNVDQCIETYKDLGEQVFGRRAHSRFSWANLYSRAPSPRTKITMLSSRRPLFPSPDENEEAFWSDDIRCRTIVCSMQSRSKKRSSQPQLLRSYAPDDSEDFELDKKGNRRSSQYLDISSVAQAMIGAPTLWESAHLSSHVNNPSLEIFYEVNSRHRETLDPIDVFLSLGCGDPKSRSSRKNEEFKPKRKLSRSLSKIEKHLSMVSDLVHYEMLRRSSSLCYYRLDVKEKLRTVRLGEWKPFDTGASTLNAIQNATTTYLKQSDVQDQLKRCAKKLVQRRRDRSETMRWESFALGIRYRCKVEPPCELKDAEGRPVLFQNRNELMDHLRTFHHKPPPDANNYQEIQALVDRGRTNSDMSEESI